MVVSGEEGLDEMSIDGPTRIATINVPGIGGTITPEAAGLASHPLHELRGGDAGFNAAALKRLLMGDVGAYRNAVLLNAAGGLIVAGKAGGWEHGVVQAASAIDDGAAKDLLARWVAYR